MEIKLNEKKKTVVNSWNEWDQLKHVIVGVAENSNIPPVSYTHLTLPTNREV